MANPGTPWYRMDNASVMYSAIQREEYSAIYRFSAFLHREADPDALQRAVDRAMPRFPGFAVRIRRGFFWYFFEPNLPRPVCAAGQRRPLPPRAFR